MSSEFAELRRTLLAARPQAVADAAVKRQAADEAHRRVEQIDDLIRSMDTEAPDDKRPVLARREPLPVDQDGRRKIRAGSSTEFAMQALTESGKPMTPRMVCDRVLALGWDTHGGAPMETVRKSLRRLVQQGRAVRVGDRYRVAATTEDGG